MLSGIPLSRRLFFQSLAAGAPVAAALPTPSAPSTVGLRNDIVNSPLSIGLHRARVFTQIWQDHAARPWPLKKALALRHYLRTVPLYLRPGDRLAGSISERPGAMPIIVELGIAENPIYTGENPEARGYLRSQVPDEIRDFWRDRNLWGRFRAANPEAAINGPLPESANYKFLSNQGHLSPSYSDLLSVGIGGIRARVANRHRLPATPDQQAWLEAAAIGLEGLSDWAARYAKLDPSIPNLSSNPPSTFHEALQLIWLAHQAIHIEGHGYSCTPDHIDQLLFPFYEADRKAGRLSDPEALALAENFTLKMYDNTFWGPKHHLTQGLCLGGSDANGRDLTNRLSWIFLEAATNLALPEPLVWIRWHKNIDQEFFDFALSRIARSTCFPLMWNDEAIVPALRNLGVSSSDARNYIAVGCNELAIPGRFYFNPAANADYLGSISKALHAPQPPSFEAFVQIVADNLRQSIAKSYAHEMKVLAATTRWGHTPLTSCFFHSQIDSARDMVTGTIYNLLTCGGIFFANAVDSLAAIREVVYDSRQATLAEVAGACSANFKGHEKLRARLLAAPKHGNDDPRLDDIIRLVERMRDLPVKEICRDPRDGSPFGNGHVVRSSAVRTGRVTPATPDGRLAGTPLAGSIAASAGMEKNGPTALLNSVAKLNGAQSWQHGYQVNLRFQAMMLKDKARRDKVRALLNVYFAKGGQELQINAIDSDMLRAAQANPEQYKDLVVRIAGFSEFFVNLTRDMQDEIIARTAHL